MQQVRRFLELIRFSHTLFALPFALFSAVLAWHIKGEFQWLELAGILLCMAFARSAAMAFNRLADRDIDALNPLPARRFRRKPPPAHPPRRARRAGGPACGDGVPPYHAPVARRPVRHRVAASVVHLP